MTLKDQIKDKKAIGLSFKVSMQDTEDLDSGKSIQIIIQDEPYILTKNKKKPISEGAKNGNKKHN